MCHTVVPERDDDAGELYYQASSPGETCTIDMFGKFAISSLMYLSYLPFVFCRSKFAWNYLHDVSIRSECGTE